MNLPISEKFPEMKCSICGPMASLGTDKIPPMKNTVKVEILKKRLK